MSIQVAAWLALVQLLNERIRALGEGGRSNTCSSSEGMSVELLWSEGGGGLGGLCGESGGSFGVASEEEDELSVSGQN